MSSVHLALHPIFPVLMLWLDGCPTGLPVGCAGSAAEAEFKICNFMFVVCFHLGIDKEEGA